MRLNRPKIHNRLQDPADEMPARRVPDNSVPAHHHSANTRSMEHTAPPQPHSFLPKLNTNLNRLPGNNARPVANDMTPWPHDQKAQMKDELTYLDKFEKVLFNKNGLHLPDIQDKKGTAARHMRIIKPKPKELIKLDVVDIGEPLYGKFEKSHELPSISGQGVKLSPRSHETSPRQQMCRSPSRNSPTRGPSRGQKFPPIGNQQQSGHKKRGPN